MKITPTSLHQAVVIEMKPIQDSRGYFSRTFCRQTLRDYGINFEVVQANTAYNKYAKTLRGMHYQLPPYSEEKLITCTQGSIFDVIIDLNRDSETFGKSYGIELSATNHLALYVPKGFAHGYQTLTEHASIHYMVSQVYSPAYESGVRWNDEAFQIQWPYTEQLNISDKDSLWKDFDARTDGIVLSGGNV